MPHIMSTLTRNRWMIVIVLILVSATVQMVSAETVHVANHVVISEVQIATDEFVELYNPTNSDIDMTGWHWCYFSDGRDWNKSYRDREFPSGATISAHCFYLVATTSSDFPTADWNLKCATHFLSDTAGSVGIFPWDPDTKTAEEAKSGRIDAVAWDSVAYVKESSEAEAPSTGKSLERKAIASSSSTTMAPGGDHHTWGNGEDTNNNSADFITKTTPEPQNSSSATEDSPSQSWFLSNTSGSDYIMYKGDMSRPEGTVTIATGQSELWQPDEPATVDVGFPAGTWDGTITFDPAPASDQMFDVEVGIGDFSSEGLELFTGDGTTTSFQLNIVASAFTVTEGDYFYLRITNNGTDNLIVKTGGGNSYVTSPPSDPGYPVPELPTLILVSAGLLILAGYAYMTKRNK